MRSKDEVREEVWKAMEREGVSRAPYLGRYKWVLVEGLDALPSEELQELVAESYRMVAAKAIQKPRKSKRAPSRRKRKG